MGGLRGEQQPLILRILVAAVEDAPAVPRGQVMHSNVLARPVPTRVLRTVGDADSAATELASGA